MGNLTGGRHMADLETLEAGPQYVRPMLRFRGIFDPDIHGHAEQPRPKRAVGSVFTAGPLIPLFLIRYFLFSLGPRFPLRLILGLAEFLSSLNSWPRLVLVSCPGLELLGLLGEPSGG